MTGSPYRLENKIKKKNDRPADTIYENSLHGVRLKKNGFAYGTQKRVCVKLDVMAFLVRFE